MSTEDPQARYYRGIKMIRYDLIKEFVLAFVVVSLIVVGLAAAFSSPDDPAVTLKSWATADPVDFGPLPPRSFHTRAERPATAPHTTTPRTRVKPLGHSIRRSLRA